MKPIYIPKGKAKEYGDYAINIYTGCPHRCYYCFAPSVLHRDREAFHGHIEPRPGIIEAVNIAVKHTYTVAASMLAGLGQMVTGKIEADVAGPIGVAQMAGQVAQSGLIPLLQFAAFLSINLGLINLLPVPVLDGGHVVTLAVEGIRGKPLNRNSLQFVQMIGFALLMLLFVLATFKDISRLKLF